MPNLKDKFINSDSQYEKNGFYIFKMKTGTLLGPVDVLVSKASISFWTSPGIVGERKKDGLEGFINKFPEIIYKTSRSFWNLFLNFRSYC